MGKVLGNVKSGKDGYNEDWTSDASITRWVNKHTAEVTEILEKMEVLFWLPEVVIIRERNLMEQIAVKEGFIARYPDCPDQQKVDLAMMKTELAALRMKKAS